MSTKLKVKYQLELEKNKVYLIKFNYNPSPEEFEALQKQFKGIFEETGCKIIVLGKGFEILNPKDLISSSEFIELIKSTVNEVLKVQNDLRSS